MHPYIFSLGSFRVPSYGTMMALGFIAAVLLCIRLGKKRGLDAGLVSDMICWVMIAGVVGARVAHVIANYSELYSRHPVEALFIWKGGLIYYGGLIGALAAMAVFARVKKVSLLGLYDIVATVLPLSHALGRVGCFLNGCCHGAPADTPLAVRFPPGTPAANMFPRETAGIIRYDLSSRPVMPVQLYEAVLNILLFILLLRLFPRMKRRGAVGAVYFCGYAIIRFGVEFARGDQRMAVGPLTVAQLVSIGLFVIGGSFLALAPQREEDNTSTT